MVHKFKIYDVIHQIAVWPLIGFTAVSGTYLTIIFGDWMINRRPIAAAARKASIANKLAEQQTVREAELMRQQKAAEKAAEKAAF